MKSLAFAAAFSSVFLLAQFTAAEANETCERTVASNREFVETWPKADTWFGSRALAVQLPENGIWPTTSPGHALAVKLFWWRDGFEPGSESTLMVTIRRLDNGPNSANVLSPTNAGRDSLGAWTMLTGLDFPDSGCWEVTGTYLNDKLTFIVETVENDKHRTDAT